MRTTNPTKTLTLHSVEMEYLPSGVKVKGSNGQEAFYSVVLQRCLNQREEHRTNLVNRITSTAGPDLDLF